MAADADADGPVLVRPTPRRPFELSLTGPSPPASRVAPTPPEQEAPRDQATLPPASAFARLLGPQGSYSSFGDGMPPSPPFATESSPSLSRTESIINLTSSTLFGIYSHVPPSRDESVFDTDTPWGTGAQTPIRRPGLDDKMYELMRRRAHSSSSPTLAPLALGSSSNWHSQPGVRRAPSRSSRPAALGVISLALRLGLLFLLGMGYGALVGGGVAFAAHSGGGGGGGGGDSDGGIARPDQNWKYLACWGTAGVALGVLLPWFDRFFETTPRGRTTTMGRGRGRDGGGVEWTLIVRGIGAFVGIAYAIRKLLWSSTLQVTMTLALANPFLWYMVDRSHSGFLLSTLVGLVGSAAILGANPDMMPAPTATHLWGGGSSGGDDASSMACRERRTVIFAGLATQESAEAAVWMLSVLFCSCVCFGNIGRRLGLSRRG